MQSKDQKVQQFLDDVMLWNDKKFDILQELRKIVFKNFPEISERMMYWWIMFSLETDFWGIFSYKNHITFEFSNGYLFDDPKNILEWTGKFRRNIKIKEIKDIKEKDVEFFVKQVIK